MKLTTIAAMIAVIPCHAQDTATESACRALTGLPDLTITSAEIRKTTPSGTPYCYVRGSIPPGIRYHVQLPLPANWNERFLNWGDHGKDGILDFADHRVAQGYAVANSNTGHDAGSEPDATFAFNNRQAEIDHGYRAVHVTVVAAKNVIRAFYKRPAKYAYHEGCSTGGRQGLMEAQRFPYDFDGIVAEGSVNYRLELMAGLRWLSQKIYSDKFAGALAFDTDGDGRLDSLTKLNVLHQAVLAKCDALDGIADRVVSDPLRCRFDPDIELKDKRCPGDVNADGCFTRRQIQTVKDFYRGAHDSKGARVYWGFAPGSEWAWASYIPHPGNRYQPSGITVGGDDLNYLFFDQDPGVPPPDWQDLGHRLDKRANPPEWAWWEFNVDDFTGGKANLMKSIQNATDPDLTRYLVKQKGKLLLLEGWCDSTVAPQGAIEYFNNIVKSTFAGKIDEAQKQIRLFMAPGMGHCGGGPGPNQWDKLAPIIEWVEKGQAPDSVVATHSSKGKVDNERPAVPVPEASRLHRSAGRAE